MSDSKAPIDVGWLFELYVECGIDDVQAQSAAEVTRVRLATRALGFRYNRPKGRTFLAPHLLKDPLSSFNRIVGKLEHEIPMYDDQTGQLSLVSRTGGLALLSSSSAEDASSRLQDHHHQQHPQLHRKQLTQLTI